jgi:histone deacetylase 1/2
LRAEFTVIDLGELHFFLGIDVKHDSTGCFLSQQWYAKDILKRADMMNCKAAMTPIDAKGKLSADGAKVDDAKTYKSLAGVLQYLTIT